MTRRTALVAMAATPALAQDPEQELLKSVVANHDKGVEYLLAKQITDPASRFQGTILNGFGIPNFAGMAGMFDTYGAALMQPKSKFYKSPLVFERLKLAAACLKKNQSAGGFLSNLDTNFNSPPDTAFAVRAAAGGLLLARQTNSREIFEVMRPFVESAADGLAVGGIHTPNHRWVLSAALAQVNEILPKAAYGKRIDQWLAEGIDIDEDGQYTERSVGTYNQIIDSALIAIAEKHNRPELFEHVRANLNSLLYLINPNGEIVTDFSRRQDQFSIATPSQEGLGLSTAMLHPEFLKPIEAGNIPTSYRKDFKHNKITRIRRDDHAATVFYNGSSRVMNINKGEAVITTIRFISAFFGKGQFKSEAFELKGKTIAMSQKLEGPYYQPFTPAKLIDSEMWTQTQKQRPRTEVSVFEQGAAIEEADGGYNLRVYSKGTELVPITIEIAFRPGGSLTGVKPISGAPDSYLIDGPEARYQVGKDIIKVSPGASAHSWTREMRYIEAKLPGPTLYLTGFAPFDHTIQFRFA
ncbi:MAG: hypothetical protein NTW74_22205 [Acidobacteria bacterium]|nr:hypothetical protein [Acidobacteriota bacterium]